MIIFNKPIILMLIPIVVGFILFGLILVPKGASLGNWLTTASIIVAIAFFLFENSQKQQDVEKLIKSTNITNCGVAESHLEAALSYEGSNGEKDVGKIPVQYYSTDSYKNHLNTLYQIDPLHAASSHLVMIEMDGANTILDNVRTVDLVRGIDTGTKPYISENIRIPLKDTALNVKKVFDCQFPQSTSSTMHGVGG